MKRSAPAIVSLWLLGSAPVAAEPIKSIPHPAVVLFWADWCAPCRAELRQLATLEAAVQPLTIVIVPLTPARGLPATIDRRRVIGDGGWDLLAAFRLPPALPAAVVLDRDGLPCATHRGGLDAAKAASLVAACPLSRRTAGPGSRPAS